MLALKNYPADIEPDNPFCKSNCNRFERSQRTSIAKLTIPKETKKYILSGGPLQKAFGFKAINIFI